MTTPPKTLADLLRRAFSAHDERVHTALPGAVVSYTASTKQVSVQPLVKMRVMQAGQITAIPLPVINQVPVQFPGTSRWQISGDLQAGDTGLLIFSEASIDRWLGGSGGGAQADPEIDHRFDINDAVFIPGVSPFGAPGIAGVATGLLLQYGSGGSPAQVLLKNDGSVTINGGSQGVARNGDATTSAAAQDAAFWTWLAAVGIVLAGLGVVAPVPTSLTGKINAGSTTVKAG